MSIHTPPGNREVSSLAACDVACGPHREGVEPKPMMHGLEKSDPCVVAMKSANKLWTSAESMERRRGAEGNTHALNMCRTQSRESMPQQPVRVRAGVQIIVRWLVNYPSWEPGALIAPAGICAGGAQQCAFLPRSRWRIWEPLNMFGAWEPVGLSPTSEQRWSAPQRRGMRLFSAHIRIYTRYFRRVEGFPG